MILSRISTSLAILVFPYCVWASSWAALAGSYSAEGQAGCVEHLKIGFQDSFGAPQIFAYDTSLPVGSNLVFNMNEGFWIDPDGLEHHAFEFKNSREHSFFQIISNSLGQMQSRIKLKIGSESEDGFDSFYYFKDNFDKGTEDYCVYLRD